MRGSCSTVLDAAASVGADVVWATGNHDEAAAFRSVFEPGVAGVSGPVNAEHDVAGLRVLVVDSSVPGRPAGTVAPESLAWLGGRLAEPAASGACWSCTTHRCRRCRTPRGAGR